MTKPRRELKDVPHSVHARLLAFAKRENINVTACGDPQRSAHPR